MGIESMTPDELQALERDIKICGIVDPAFAAARSLHILCDRQHGGDFIAPISQEVDRAIASEGNEGIQKMLYAQAISLQKLYHHWMSLAALSDDVETIDRLMQLALKAQNQCRQTLQALLEARNPTKKTQFVKIGQQLNQLLVDQSVEPSRG